MTMTHYKMEVWKTMMNRVEVEELLKTLEKIRVEKYPDIPEELIKSIVNAQFEHQDDTTQGSRETKRLIDDFLRKITIDDIPAEVDVDA